LTIHNDGSLNPFVIVRLDRTIQSSLDSPIESGNDVIVVIYDVVYDVVYDVIVVIYKVVYKYMIWENFITFFGV